MSKITDKEKIDYLFNRNQNLASTDVNYRNLSQPIHENKKFIMANEVFIQNIPLKPTVSNIDQSLYKANYNVSINDFYKKDDSCLKKDADGIILQVSLLKLQKIHNTSNSWYYLDSNGNNFLSYIIPSNYGTHMGSNIPYYEIGIYSQDGLEKHSNNESYLSNEKIKIKDYIFDYNNGILILAKNLKDTSNKIINETNPPYISFYKYTGKTLNGENVGGGTSTSTTSGGSTGLGGQWTKNDDDDSIYYKNGNVKIGLDGTNNTNPNLSYELEISGNVYISNNLHVKGDQIIHDDLHVIDDISANTLNISGTADISGNLTVEGAKTVVQDISGQDASFNNLSARNIYIENDIYKNGKIINLNPTVNNIKQTFYEVLTQQPSKFNKGISTKSSTSIVLNWSYVDILANQTSQLIAKLNFQSSLHLQNIPHIDKIYVDISGNSGSWINLDIINVTGDYTVDNNSYEINLLNIKNILGSNPGKFDARVYGENFGTNDYPNVETRAIIFNDLQFGESKKPGKPIITNEMAINSENNFTFQAKVDETEDGISNSTAVIIDSLTRYKIHMNKSSSIIVHDKSFYLTHSQTITPNKSNSEVFDITLNNLIPGIQYDYNIKVKNNINSEYSDFSDQKTSNFLRLPGNNSVSTTTLNFSQNSNEQKISVTTPIDTANLNNNQIYYKNIATNTTFTFDNTNTQTIQITKPYTVNQQNDTVGYGKYVDNVSELVKVECLIDANQKQIVAFHGFNTTDINAGTATRSSSSYNFFNSPSQEDIWKDDNKRKGFRIKGNFQLNNISNINNNIGAAKPTKYTLEYKYTRKSDVGGASTNTQYDIYIDNLPTDPSINNNATTTAQVKTVVYTMGIPSVKTIDIAFSRKYQNINSLHKYLPGNLKIAQVTSIQNINFTTKNVILDRNSILNTGEYDFSFTEDGKYYDQPMGIGNPDTDLSVSERVYSLKKTNGIGVVNTLSIRHHFDMNSYNNVGSNSISSKLSLNGIYEIASNNISKLGNDVGDIQVTQYTSHQTIPKDWTLLYYGGAFRTNTSVAYPNVNNYEWDSIVTTDSQYSAGTTSYDLNGVSTGTNNTGYKWIVFKASKITTGDKDYSILGQDVELLKNADNVSYLNLKQIFKSFFQANTITQLFNPSNNNAIGFCKATNTSNFKRAGSFKQSFDTNGGVWISNGNISTTKKYEEIASDMKFGAYVEGEDGNNNEKNGGIYVNKTALNDDLEIFVGLKNNTDL